MTIATPSATYTRRNRVPPGGEDLLVPATVAGRSRRSTATTPRGRARSRTHRRAGPARARRRAEGRTVRPRRGLRARGTRRRGSAARQGGAVPGSISRSRASAGRVRIRPNSTFPRRLISPPRSTPCRASTASLAALRTPRSSSSTLFAVSVEHLGARPPASSEPPRTSASSAGAAPGPRSANRGRRAVHPRARLR